MGLSFAGLLSYFAILTSTFSLPPSLTLMSSNSTGISKYNNQTLPYLTSGPIINCQTRYGEDMSVASCRNALQKIPRSSELHRFTRGRRKQEAGSDQILTPIRYLSDDGICAIVCCPYLFLLFQSVLSWLYKVVMGIIRALSVVYRRNRSLENMEEEPKLTTSLSFIQDITLSPGRADDEASGDMISDSANSLLDRCVVWKHKGGTIVNFSRFSLETPNNLSLATSNKVNNAFPGVAEPRLLTRGSLRAYQY